MENIIGMPMEKVDKFVIVHHTDLDGYMAASIAYDYVRRWIEGGTMPPIASNLKNNEGETIPFMKYVAVTEAEIRFCSFNYGIGISDSDTNAATTETVFKDSVTIIVDCSISEQSLEQFAPVMEQSKMVIWIDHHLSSKEFIDANGIVNSFSNTVNKLYYYVNMEHSAAMLAEALLGFGRYFDRYRFEMYGEFLNTVEGDGNIFYKYAEIGPIPASRSVVLTDDYDRYVNTYRESKELNSSFYVFRDEHGSVETLKRLYTETNVQELVDNGHAIMAYVYQQANINMGRTHVETIDGIETLCLNAQGGPDSFTTEAREAYQMVCLYRYNGKARKWIYSLYSHLGPEGPCCKIATAHGGGGHAGAAGFQSEHLIFENK